MKRFPFLLFFLLGISFFSCDQLEEDVIPRREMLSDQSRFIWASPHGPSVFTLESLYASANPFSLQITAKPQRGELQINPHGYLLYKPGPAFSSGQDRIGFSVLQNGVTLASDTLFILMMAEGHQPPCQAGAISDSLRIPPASNNILLDVLTNDLYCQGTQLEVSLAVNPAHGSIRLEGSQLFYTPTSGYKGQDYFIYQLCQQSPQGAPPICSFAFVHLQVLDSTEENCSFILSPDTFTLPPDTAAAADSIVLDILANDRVCAEVSSLEISPPQQGKAYISDKQLYYQRKKGFRGTDTFRYTLCEGPEACLETSITIHCT